MESNNSKDNQRWTWQGARLTVKVLRSTAGVGQQILVGSPGGSILVDAGDGVLWDLLDNNVPLERLEAVFITHGHFDHMGGLHSLLGFMRMIDRKKALAVYAPSGSVEVLSVVNGFKQCYPDTVPFDLSVVELSSGQECAVGDMDVIGYSVIHCGSVGKGIILDQIPASGYRISCRGETVAISGDTGNCPSVRELVRGADLAIVEGTYASDAGRSAQMLKRVHLTEAIAHEIGSLAKHHILVHRVRKR